MDLRHLAERYSRGLVFKRRLSADFCRLPVYVSPQAGLRYWFSLSKADPLLCRMAKEMVRPGVSVWDVGANVGLFSFCASALTGSNGSVLAIEPDVWLCGLLTKSAITNDGRSAKVRVLCAAVSDNNRVSELQISDRSRAVNHLSDSPGSNQFGRAEFSSPALTVSLDFLLDYFPPPSVLKIDVETHELRVLLGASRLIETWRPTIFCEVSGGNARGVSKFLQDRGYKLYAADAEPPRTVLSTAPWDTLAIPV